MDPLPLPDQPLLRRLAEALEAQQHVAEIWDADWRLAYLTRDYLVSVSAPSDVAAVGIGEPIYSARTLAIRSGWPGFATTESWLATVTRLLPAIAYDLPGGVADLRRAGAPELTRELDGVTPRPADSLILEGGEIKFGRRTTPFWSPGTRLLDEDGGLAGHAFFIVPAVSGATLSLLATSDHRSLERLLDIVHPARRAAAVLYADLEGSSALAQSLPTADYFRLVKRLMTRMDDEIVKRCGLVGKHAGDGLTALFLVDHQESESAAARACVESAQAIRGQCGDIAERSGVEPSDVVVRFGLHWGATLYVGGVLTTGRSEFTAHGDEMNEAARIEASAAGGRLLASKALIERLGPDDHRALGLDARPLRFTPLGKLASATDKARRDAAGVAVCDLAPS